MPLIAIVAATAMAPVAQTPPVVAVFAIRDSSRKKAFNHSLLSQLGDYLEGQLAEGGKFRIVPQDIIRGQLQTEKKATYNQCFDEACQIDIGKAVAAEKTLNTQLLKIGKKCIFKGVLFDLRKEISEKVANVKGDCDDDGLLVSIEKLAAKLKTGSAVATTSGLIGSLNRKPEPEPFKPPPPKTAPPTTSGSSGSPFPKVNCAGAEACHEVGIDYLEGRKGKSKDTVLANAYWFEGCRRGYGHSCTRLGYSWEKNRGVVESSLEKAVEYYRKACDNGHEIGCSNLAYMYEKGRGTKLDYNEAFKLYTRACDKGSSRGCTNLGYMHKAGLGIPVNFDKANRYYRMGCDKGNSRGCTNLGYMYEQGRGVTKSIVQARKFYKKGCDGGNDRGCKKMREL